MGTWVAAACSGQRSCPAASHPQPFPGTAREAEGVDVKTEAPAGPVGAGLRRRRPHISSLLKAGLGHAWHRRRALRPPCLPAPRFPGTSWAPGTPWTHRTTRAFWAGHCGGGATVHGDGRGQGRAGCAVPPVAGPAEAGTAGLEPRVGGALHLPTGIGVCFQHPSLHRRQQLPSGLSWGWDEPRTQVPGARAPPAPIRSRRCAPLLCPPSTQTGGPLPCCL